MSVVREARNYPFPGASFALAGVLVAVCALTWLVARHASGPLLEEPRMRVGVAAVPEHEPLAVARADGMLDPGRVLVVEFGSFESLRNAFLDGNVHACVFPLDDALRLVAGSGHVRIERFLGRTRSPLVLMAAPEIARPADLRGRVVGLESGCRAMAALRALLAPAGLDLADVRLQQLEAGSAPQLLRDGVVSAVLTYAPACEHLARAGEHEIARWTPPADGDLLVLVANDRAHRHAGGQLAHVGAAWLAGAAALRLGPDTVLAGVARREELPANEVAGVLGTQSWFTAAAAARLRGAAGRAELDSAWAAVAARWRALGIADAPPRPQTWEPARESGS